MGMACPGLGNRCAAKGVWGLSAFLASGSCLELPLGSDVLLEHEQPPHPGPVRWAVPGSLFLVTAEPGIPSLTASLPPQVRALRDPLHRRRLPGLQGLFCGPSQGHCVGKGQCRATLPQWAQGLRVGRHGRAGGAGNPVPSLQPSVPAEHLWLGLAEHRSCG